MSSRRGGRSRCWRGWSAGKRRSARAPEGRQAQPKGRGRSGRFAWGGIVLAMPCPATHPLGLILQLGGFGTCDFAAAVADALQDQFGMPSLHHRSGGAPSVLYDTVNRLLADAGRYLAPARGGDDAFQSRPCQRAGGRLILIVHL